MAAQVPFVEYALGSGAGGKRFTEIEITLTRNKNLLRMTNKLIICAGPSQTSCGVSAGTTYVATACSGSIVVTVYDFESGRVRILSGG